MAGLVLFGRTGFFGRIQCVDRGAEPEPGRVRACRRARRAGGLGFGHQPESGFGPDQSALEIPDGCRSRLVESGPGEADFSEWGQSESGLQRAPRHARRLGGAGSADGGDLFGLRRAAHLGLRHPRQGNLRRGSMCDCHGRLPPPPRPVAGGPAGHPGHRFSRRAGALGSLRQNPGARVDGADQCWPRGMGPGHRRPALWGKGKSAQ
ncbi:MAG: hypothetical protein JWL81_3275 [Verrucomicrobiales bacterium]|nr:hypothetical protein [Verrucomicrobiales bacterium]